MKKIICTIFLLCLITQSFCVLALPAEQAFSRFKPTHEIFSDMDGFEWAAEAVEYLSRAGVVSGVGGSRFMPKNAVTRKEFIKLVCGVCGITDKSAESDYSDVLKNDWSYIYVSSAKNAGMLDIYGSRELGANVPVTREDMAYLCAEALRFAGISCGRTEKYVFPDDDEISYYAKDAVYALMSEDIISGRETGLFDPKGNANRAEAAKIIYGVSKLVRTGY